MDKATPAKRTAAVFGAELLSAGLWAMIDAQSLADNAERIAVAGLILLIVAWLWDDIAEFREWKRRGTSTEWWSLGRIGRHIVYDSSWGAKYSPKMGDWDDTVLREVAERAARGELPTRGILRELGHNQLASSEIDPQLWQDAYWQPSSALLLEDWGGSHFLGKRQGSYGKKPHYEKVIAPKGKVLEIWPRCAASAKPTSLQIAALATLGEREKELASAIRNAD